jgi:hypothetical protein
LRRKGSVVAFPPHLAVYTPGEWTVAPLTDEERRTFGATAGTAEGMAGVARSRWLWARWEWAQSAGLPGAVHYFVEYLQGPPQSAV